MVMKKYLGWVLLVAFFIFAIAQANFMYSEGVIPTMTNNSEEANITNFITQDVPVSFAPTSGTALDLIMIIGGIVAVGFFFVQGFKGK